MNQQELLRNGTRVSMLYHAIRNGKAGLDDIPNLIKQIITDEMWRALLVEETGEVVEFSSFEEMVTTTPPEGLGTAIDTLKRLCKDDNEVYGLLVSEVTPGPGGDKKSEDYKIIHNNIMNDSQAIQGTSKEYGLRKLDNAAQSNPKAKSLRSKVLASEMSVHAALVELGIRKKTITIPIDPEKAARSIVRNFEPEQVEELIECLQDLL